MTKEKHPSKKVFYITTAIDYVNGNPHIGHAFEKIIADVYARWYRNNGYTTFFLTGTDENAQKNVEAAQAAKKELKAFVDEKAQVFKDFCEKLHLSHDDFVRTTQERHKTFATWMFKKIQEKGDMYEGVYKGEYCTPCESFWTETQLIDNNCPQCKRPTKPAEEEAFFFKMSKYQAALIEHIEKHPEFIVPATRRNEILARLQEELRDLCVSRSTFKIGIPVPGDDKHVIYVWFEALMNYISGLEYPGEKYETFWKEAVHVIGKDIIWFHCVIWPCALLAAELPLPKQVYAHGFINDKDGEKMSKSKGNVVDPFEMMKKYSPDVLKYYLLKSVSSGDDGNFDEAALIKHYNNELANDLGNVVKRIQTLLKKEGGGIQQDHAKDELHPGKYLEKIHACMEKRQHHRALEEVWVLIRKINAYLNEQEPWKVEDKEKKHNILYNATEALRFATAYLAAFLPDTAAKIAEQLHFTLSQTNKLTFGEGSFSVKKEEILFPKMEDKETKEEVKKESAEENLFPLRLKVGKILEVKDHPDADKLYVLQIDLGNEKRQICAGIKPFYQPKQLEGKHIILVSNLKKAKLRGVESNGMLLAAGENARILTAPDAEPGEEVFVEGYKNKESQIRYEEFSKLELRTKEKRVEVFGTFLKTKHGAVQVDAEDGLQVK